MYVTADVLQRRYPPGLGAFVTQCSDVNLTPEAFPERPFEFRKNPPTESWQLVRSINRIKVWMYY